MVGGHNIIIIIDIPGNQRPRGENPCAKCRRVVSSGGDVDEDEDEAGDGDVDGASENWMEI